ncbi:MAG: glycoside hydrolase family 65 protein [Candidatus Omnitrophica bacterium]|nr:glycoside hydrolase family 65 protein [Candidatus Omnitrophota bacterium]
MKSKFSNYLSKKEWLLDEQDPISGPPDKKELNAKETLFTLGNGYLGSRGIYEEIPEGTEQGTYLAGVYDAAASMVPELVNVPNPIDFRIIIEGEKLDIGRMDVIENKRVLDMGKGLLVRRTIFSDTKKRRLLYESARFFSMHDKHIGAMCVSLKVLDEPARIIVQDTVDDSVTNAGSLLEGRKRHTQLADVSTVGDLNYMCVKTFTRKTWIAYATYLAVARSGIGKDTGTLNKIFNMLLKKGETVRFTKIFSIHTSKDFPAKQLKKTATKELNRAKRLGFDELFKRHENAWKKRWEKSDVKIIGDNEAEKALRFNIYHLIISGNENDENISIGARTLSGHGYRGHIFWDTELFVLPFFIYTNPKIARNLLMYRFLRLNEARRIAKEKGYRGVLFPWESADTGKETTPPYAKNLDGSIIEIHTMDMEHHIVSDVAYGVFHYFEATGDIDFMYKAGIEIMFETARFWASRVTYNKKTEKYEIKNVIGPDEFHEGVDNNAYTNRMAGWNLRKAKELHNLFEKKHPQILRKIKEKISLNKEEPDSWAHIADRIRIPVSKSKGIIKEFDGYLKKRDVVLKTFNSYFMPVIPKDISLSEIAKTQLVKQADVVMLMYLFPEEFTTAQRVKSYVYYVTRTLHKSSLSPSIYSIFASETGDTTRGYALFLFSLYADLKNTHGNSAEGIHAASLGGTWQAAIMGFAGFRIMDEMPSFEPRLPGHWRGIKFSIEWKECILRVSVSNKKINFFATAKKKGSILVKCFNSVYMIRFNKNYTIRKNG